MKFLEALRLRLEFVAVWLMIVMARAMPLQVASWLSGKLWRLIAPHLSRQKRALANLELAFPEKSLSERKAIAAAMWENLGEPSPNFSHQNADQGRPHRLRAGGRVSTKQQPARSRLSSADFILRNGKSWRMAASGSAFPSSASISAYPTPMWTRSLRAFASPSTRRVLRPRLLWPRASSSGQLRTAPPVLLRRPQNDNGPFVPFFGQPARSTVFPALLARRAGVPLYAGAAFRRPGGRFSVRIMPISMPQTSNSAADALAATKTLQRQFEAFIREAPEQWTWAHRKWG